MWERNYDANGGIVAKYSNSNNVEVLQVMELNDSYITVPNFAFIARCTVNKKEPVLAKSKDMLDAACEIIENDYNSQAGVIKMDFR